MEKQFKPVPDVECLKYHGTPGKPDIKIFVSHRIDLESETIDNPLYIPVRCGAAYDEREGVTMLGDDTGDNISEKRESFCELTVLYWAWKNVEADYYGLCHYRRYISLSKKRHCADNIPLLGIERMTEKQIEKFALKDAHSLYNDLLQYDLITTPCEDVRLTGDGCHSSVYQLCKDRIRDFDMEGVDIFIAIIKEKYPEYSDDVDKYFSGHLAKFYNCFIMRKDIFEKFCSMLFDILFELERQLDTRHYGMWKTRMPGFMGECFFGIFLIHLSNQKNECRICEKELVYISDTEKKKANELLPAFKHNNIPIVFSTSDFFCAYASVFVKSLIDNANPEKNYDIIVFESSISKQNKLLLKGMVDNIPNVSLRFYNPKPFIQNIKFFVNSENQSEEAYYRLLAPYILEKYEKAIVMDCDIIAMTDISKLYDIDIKDYCFAAALDVVWQGWFNGDKKIQKYCKEILTMEDPYRYVNTGVVLFNLKRCREEQNLNDLLKIAQSHKFIVQEQDILNLVFDGKIKYIDIAWNMYAMVAPHIKDTIDSFAPVASKKLYYEAHKAPHLLHWAAQPKPWIYPEMDYGYMWWSVARKSPFYEIIILRSMDIKLGQLHPAVYDLQKRAGIFDTRSGARKLADKLFPYGSYRRKFAKMLLPKGSLRWRFCKQIYYILKPQYRPSKIVDEEIAETEN